MRVARNIIFQKQNPGDSLMLTLVLLVLQRRAAVSASIPIAMFKRRYGDKAEKSCVRQFVADHIIMEVRQRLYLVYLQF